MANFADCRLVTDDSGEACIVAVTSARPDGLKGCYYTLHTPDGKLVWSGESKGWDGEGAGSALSAMKAGKAAARRWLARQQKTTANVEVSRPREAATETSAAVPRSAAP